MRSDLISIKNMLVCYTPDIMRSSNAKGILREMVTFMINKGKLMMGPKSNIVQILRYKLFLGDLPISKNLKSKQGWLLEFFQNNKTTMPIKSKCIPHRKILLDLIHIAPVRILNH